MFRTRVSAAEVEAAVTAPGGPLIGSRRRSRPRGSFGTCSTAAVALPPRVKDPLANTSVICCSATAERLLRDEPWTHADIPLLDEADVAIGESRLHSATCSPTKPRISQRCSSGWSSAVPARAGPLSSRSWRRQLRRVADDWDDLLRGVDVLDRSRVAELAIGYRVPSQIADLAATLVPRMAPDLIVPTAVRMGPEDPRIVQIAEDVLGTSSFVTCAAVSRGSA